MWTLSWLDDPLCLIGKVTTAGTIKSHIILRAKSRLDDWLGSPEEYQALRDGGRCATVALADAVARHLASHTLSQVLSNDGAVVFLELLDNRTQRAARRRTTKGRRNNNHHMTPFMFERSDIYCHGEDLHLYLRVLYVADETQMECESSATTGEDHSKSQVDVRIRSVAHDILVTALNLHTNNPALASSFMHHVAVAVVQDRLRNQLRDSLDAVAFCANESIMPRKSGASSLPMASPPAVAFQAPRDSNMSRTVHVNLGLLRPYLMLALKTAIGPTTEETASAAAATMIAISGLLIPRGISLICGGGYHGKSTLLRCLAAGVYNKVPGDGREFCVTVDDAVTVRAEDGRYVNHCNVSAFLANLPSPPPPPSLGGVDTAALREIHTTTTTHFCSGEASGSTSQAANVVEAIEMGASALLVDEDVSAANFMARDGRMRALVMDESITPLLYRVNGLFQTHGISSIVVVGGVGDWLDVPNQVLLMDKYLCKDATAKAQSVSKQFSHGHVQYGGRGVVHRLEWSKTGTPAPRRPTAAFTQRFVDATTIIVSILEGGNTISIVPADLDDDDGDDEERYIDLSRCEQLMGKQPQLYGCGLAVIWLLAASHRHPELGMAELFKRLDQFLDSNGLAPLVEQCFEDLNEITPISANWNALVESIGVIYRPRRFEVGQALTRFRGIEFEELPAADDTAENVALAETERQKQRLLEMWNQRRANKLNGVE